MASRNAAVVTLAATLLLLACSDETGGTRTSSGDTVARASATASSGGAAPGTSPSSPPSRADRRVTVRGVLSEDGCWLDVMTPEEAARLPEGIEVSMGGRFEHASIAGTGDDRRALLTRWAASLHAPAGRVFDAYRALDGWLLVCHRPEPVLGGADIASARVMPPDPSLPDCSVVQAAAAPGAGARVAQSVGPDARAVVVWIDQANRLLGWVGVELLAQDQPFELAFPAHPDPSHPEAALPDAIVGGPHIEGAPTTPH